jgi:subtilisin family serine protease
MKNRLLTLLGVFICVAVLVGLPSLALDDSTITDLFRPGEIVVTLRPGASVSSFNARHNTTTLEQLAGTNSYRLGLTPGETVEQKLGAVSGDPDLLSAQPNFEFQAPEIRQGSQAFIDQGSQAFIDGQSPANFYEQPLLNNLRIEEAHEFSRGAGVKVAVIDTGLDFNHPLFAGRAVAPYYDFVSNDALPADEPNGTGAGHGTFVAGLIVRAAPDARLMPLRAFSSDGRGTSFNIARALRYAADNSAHVVNMSFGLLDNDPLIDDAVEYAAERNVFLVASVGNENLERVHYPASEGEPLAVTATNANDLKAWFANYGVSVHVAAPGAGIHSAYPGNRWAFWGGTSFSTALVSGEAALLLAPNLLLERQTLREKIVTSGVALDPLNPSYAGKLGSVRVDFRTALERLSLLTATSVDDNKTGKTYRTGGPDGDEPLRDLNTTAEEYKCEIEAGANFWWEASYADPAPGPNNPSGVFVNVHYRSETGWAGALTAQYHNGSTLVAAVSLPVNSSEDTSVGKGQKGVFRWNLSSFVTTRDVVNAGRVRFVNQSSNGKKVWIVYSDLEAQMTAP